MVVAYLRGILKRVCVDARDHLVEDMILDALDADMNASERDTMARITASTLECCDPKKRSSIMNQVERSLTRAAQLRRIDIFDSSRQLGLRGFGADQALSLVKLFRLAKKDGIIQSIHQSCHTATKQD